MSYAHDSHRLLLLYTESPRITPYPGRRALTHNRPRRVPRSFNNYDYCNYYYSNQCYYYDFDHRDDQPFHILGTQCKASAIAYWY